MSFVHQMWIAAARPGARLIYVRGAAAPARPAEDTSKHGP